MLEKKVQTPFKKRTLKKNSSDLWRDRSFEGGVGEGGSGQGYNEKQWIEIPAQTHKNPKKMKQND